MPRDFVPSVSLVGPRKDGAAIRRKIYRNLVTRHGLPENGEVTGFLRQPIAHGLPGSAAVA
jgi:hypothetical protein